jgi:predicted secreted protein
VGLKDVRIALVSGLVLATAGCDSSSASLSGSDKGRTMYVHSTDQIVLTLDTSPSTGYTWCIDQIDDSVLTLANSN